MGLELAGGVAEGFGCPLDASFAHGAEWPWSYGSGNVAGLPPVVLLAARSLKCASRCEPRRRAVARVASLFFGFSRRLAATGSIQSVRLIPGTERIGFAKTRRGSDAAGAGPRALVTRGDAMNINGLGYNVTQA